MLMEFFCTYMVAKTSRMVRLTWMTISIYSSAKNLAVKLMMTRRIVGTNRVSRLLMMGLPKVTSTMIAFMLLMIDLHILILLKV